MCSMLKLDLCGSQCKPQLNNVQVGIKDPGMIAIPSTRNEAAFMLGVVGSTSIGAVAAGAFLPGQVGKIGS